MNVDNALEIIGVITEVAVAALLVHKRTWRTLPVFAAYCIWALVSDAAACGINLVSKEGYGIGFYVTITVIDFVFQLSVLIELAWSVLRPLRSRLSRRALWLVAALILAAGAAIWPFADHNGLALPSQVWRFVFQLQQTATVLRVLFFLLLAAGSQFLSIGWRDRELQVATGFGFYSLISLAVAALNAHQASAVQLVHLYRVVSVSFLVSLLYWMYCFARAEATRREFTPQMQTVLLSLASTARLTRNHFSVQEAPAESC